MATLADAPAHAPDARSHVAPRRLNPTLCFWIAGLIAYGGAAANFATGHFLDQIPRDLWQHLAALRALIENPFQPTNPFVPTDDFSRHFHPYWVGVALVARLLGWNEWQAIIFSGFFSAGVLLAGIYAFGRVFYRDRWGPLALLAATVLGWLLPVSHTGYHSMGTLIEGIAYPAALLMGLSFLLWAAVIHALRDPRWLPAIAGLSALMFATHPLGAGIGFIVASCFIAFLPDAALKHRTAAAAAVAFGLLLSTAWPYFNPIAAVRDTGNATWVGGVNYYSPGQLIAAFVPQAAGLIGLYHPDFKARGLPLLNAFRLFFLIFVCGLLGVMIAMRFLMPAVLMLHIGMGALFLVLGRRWASYTNARQLALFGAAVLNVTLFLFFSYSYLAHENRESRKTGNVYLAAKSLTADIPDTQPVAVYDVAVWPIVATGQRAASIPWPEPGIPDLARRQSLNDRLFDPALSSEERVKLARSVGVRTLILDRGGPLRRRIPPGIQAELRRKAVRFEQAGPFLRFDLY